MNRWCPVADHDCNPTQDAAAQRRKLAEDQRTRELIRLSAEHAARGEHRFSQAELNAAAEWAHQEFNRARDEHARAQLDWAGVERRNSGRR
jgi:hypothetical protein